MSYSVAGSPPSRLYERIGKSDGVSRSTSMSRFGGEVVADLIDPRLHLLQRERHVGRRRERDVRLAAAANRARLHPRHARHDADRLLDRPGDAEQHLPRAERLPSATTVMREKVSSG